MTNLMQKLIVVASATLLAATTVGCKNDEKAPAKTDNRIHGEKFLDSSEVRDVQVMSDTQCASGARYDATLYWFNFDKGSLNSSGAAKLDSMMSDDDTNNPLTVYVDVPQDDFWTARTEAIATHCKERSVAVEQLKVVRGPNPATYHPAAPGVASMKADAALGTTAVGTQTSEGGTSMK